MLLDELIEFDIQELTQWKIIFSFYKTWWLVLLSVLFLGMGCLFFFCFIPNFLSRKNWLFTFDVCMFLFNADF